MSIVSYQSAGDQDTLEDRQDVIQVIDALEDLRRAASKAFHWLSHYRAVTISLPREPLCCTDYQEIHCLMYPDSLEAEEAVLVDSMFANINCRFTLPAGSLAELGYKVAEMSKRYRHLLQAEEILRRPMLTPEQVKQAISDLQDDGTVTQLAKIQIADIRHREKALEAVTNELCRYEHALERLRALLHHEMFIPVSELPMPEAKKKVTNELFMAIYDSIESARPGRAAPNIADAYNITALMELMPSERTPQSSWYPYLLSHTGALIRPSTFRSLVTDRLPVGRTHEFILEPLVQWILDFARRRHSNIEAQLNHISNSIISVIEGMLTSLRSIIGRSLEAPANIPYSTFERTRLPEAANLPVELGIAYEEYKKMVYEPLLGDLEKAYEMARVRGFSVSHLVSMDAKRAATSPHIPRVTWTKGSLVAKQREDLALLLTRTEISRESMRTRIKETEELLSKTKPREETIRDPKKTTYKISSPNGDLIFASQFYEGAYFSAYWPASLTPPLVEHEAERFLRILARNSLGIDSEAEDGPMDILCDLPCKILLLYDCCIISTDCSASRLGENLSRLHHQHSKHDEETHNSMLRHIRIETPLADVVADMVLREPKDPQILAVVSTKDISPGLARLFGLTALEFYYADLIAERFGEKFAAHINQLGGRISGGMA